MRIHHVQIMIVRGGEPRALHFYEALLGLERIPRPDGMPNPEGVWLRCGDDEIHLGVADGPPDAQSRAHVALELDDLDTVASRLESAGFALVPAQTLGGLRRWHVRDPFQNRIELMGK